MPSWVEYTPEYGRKKQLERRYKMTPESYDFQLRSQGGHCALCEADQATHKRRMSVDHDHNCCAGHESCGKCLRGILCANCNRKIGFLEHVLRDGRVIARSDTWLSRALRYLDSYAVQFNFGHNVELLDFAGSLMEIYPLTQKETQNGNAIGK